MNMDEKRLADGLRKEGFHHTFVWQDGPNAFYPDHEHQGETAHIILSGEMTLILQGHAQTYHAGERCDVPPHTVHSARIGPAGCRYVIGER